MKLTEKRLKERPFVFKRSGASLDGMGARDVYIAFHKRGKRDSFIYCGIAIRNPSDKADGGYAHKLASDRAIGVEPGGFRLGKTIYSGLRTSDRSVIDPMVDYVIAMHRFAMKFKKHVNNHGIRQGGPVNSTVAPVMRIMVPRPSIALIDLLPKKEDML